jgi:hypothetical protein
MRSVEVTAHVKVVMDGPIDLDNVTEPTMTLHVASNYTWFPLKPGEYKVGWDVYGPTDNVTPFLHGTVMIGVYGASITPKSARMVQLRIWYRDGQGEGNFGSWSGSQLVQVIAHEWAYTEDSLHKRESLLFEVTSSSSMDALLALFRRRCKVDKFHNDVSMTEVITNTPTTVLIRRSMKNVLNFTRNQCMGTATFDIEDTSLDVTAELLASLGPLELHKQFAHHTSADQLAGSLTRLLDGIKDLVYRTYTNIKGDSVGSNRSIFIQITPDLCVEVAFSTILRTVQPHSKYSVSIWLTFLCKCVIDFTCTYQNLLLSTVTHVIHIVTYRLDRHTLVPTSIAEDESTNDCERPRCAISNVAFGRILFVRLRCCSCSAAIQGENGGHWFPAVKETCNHDREPRGIS